MPELRHNLLTREWVIISTERAKSPEDFVAEKKPRKPTASLVSNCPFCPGNEKLTPPETYAVRNHGGWRVRVTPNKFAALADAGAPVRSFQGIRRSVKGIGIHEVIVDTPDHSKSLALLSTGQVEVVLQTYLNRFLAASRDPRIEQVTIFKNHGEGAGTTIEHSHSQLIAAPVITAQLRDRLINALRHFDEFGECIFCRVLEQELKEGARVVYESEHFVAFVQYAALTPFSMLVMPRRHMACFSEVSDTEAVDLAINLRHTLLKLRCGLDDPDYNYTIRTAPLEYMGVKYYHWYLSVIPRLTTTSGFELGSGMFINVSVPEQDAAFLRRMIVE